MIAAVRLSAANAVRNMFFIGIISSGRTECPASMHGYVDQLLKSDNLAFQYQYYAAGEEIGHLVTKPAPTMAKPLVINTDHSL
jgi:hypothetical protein